VFCTQNPEAARLGGRCFVLKTRKLPIHELSSRVLGTKPSHPNGMPMTNHLARAWRLYELRRYEAVIEEALRHLADFPNDGCGAR
jgi:hypothetical protein